MKWDGMGWASCLVDCVRMLPVAALPLDCRDACDARPGAKNEHRDSGVDVSIGVPRTGRQGRGRVRA